MAAILEVQKEIIYFSEESHFIDLYLKNGRRKNHVLKVDRKMDVATTINQLFIIYLFI